MGLSREGCVARRESLLESVDADLVIISNPRHLFYFANLLVSPLAFGSWGRPFLIMNAHNSHTTLVTDNFLGGDVPFAFADDIHTWTWYNHTLPDPGIPLFPNSVAQLRRHLGDTQGKRVGVELGWMPHGADIADSVDITEAILEMRRRKYPDEVALIREAITTAEAGLRAVREQLRPGLTEIDIHGILYSGVASEAGCPILMMGDVLSGPRAMDIAGPPSTRAVAEGELLILDVAPIVNGYRADFTATLCVGGNPTDEQLQVEGFLHEAVQAGANALRPGAIAKDVFRAVYDVLDKHGWADAFLNHAGHGLGLGHPEAPFLVSASDEVIQVGDVISLEPGLYKDGWGARIEHNYLVTDDGAEQLSHHQTTFA